MMKGVAGADWLAMFLGRWKRAAVLLLLIWIAVSYLVMSPLRCSEGQDEQAATFQQRLRSVSAQLDSLRAQHTALIKQIKRSKLSGHFPELEGALWDDGPSEAYETVRRRLLEHTKELWYYVSHELTRAISEPDRAGALQTMLANVQHRKSVLLADHSRLEAVDGHAAWRAREAANVSALVQRRLRALQNPPDCDTARKLVCNLNKGCGFGCQLHHIAYCLIFAYATERTLVLNSRGWRYDAKGWDRVFHALSDNCLTYDDIHMKQWPDMEVYYRITNRLAKQSLTVNEMEERIFRSPGDFLKNMEVYYRITNRLAKQSLTVNEMEERIFRSPGDFLKITQDAKVVSLPFIDSISQKPKFLPLAIPKDLAHRIVRFNGDPASWWVGQMLVYILRPRDHVQKTINDTIARLNYRNPIVGVHIRRTDKVGTEAAFHHIHEYMKHAQHYWQTQELLRQPGDPPLPRRVYLASDDPNVLADARGKYPDVEFVGDPMIARTAATHRRYTPASLHGLLVDLTLLSRADYLVCTFSSQVGRVAYELMQGNRVDASNNVFSLDDIYYFGGQNAHDRAATIDHSADQPNEISFRAGDLIGVAGNHWNGYGRGTNRRTNQNGLIPWYKTADHLVLYPFPEYKHVARDPDARGPPGDANT